MNEAEQRLKARFKKEFYVDYGLVFIVLFLLAFGLVTLYSTSSYEANLELGDSAYYLKHQLAAIVVGVGLMMILSRFPSYRVLNRLAVPAYAAAAVLLLMIIPFGYTANGAKRWIRIFGVSVQPAEVAKLAMIIFLASLICKMQRNVVSRKGFFLVMLTPLPICLMVYGITRNLSSAIIIMGIAFLMLFVATPGYRRFILILGGGISAAALIVYAISKASYSSSMNYRFARVLAWLDPEAYASGKGFQTLQALYAIGSGGVFGKGLGQSMQKMGFIPEAQNDMIFSIICEELGLFGAIAVIMMFVLLIWRLMIIANNAPDLFGALLVVGVMGHISIQVILNIAVVTNVIPNTGITLPFISYGGSAVLLQLAEIGMVLNVARSIPVNE